MTTNRKEKSWLFPGNMLEERISKVEEPLKKSLTLQQGFLSASTDKYFYPNSNDDPLSMNVTTVFSGSIGADIAPISAKPSETEFLMPPGTQITWRAFKKTKRMPRRYGSSDDEPTFQYDFIGKAVRTVTGLATEACVPPEPSVISVNLETKDDQSFADVASPEYFDGTRQLVVSDISAEITKSPIKIPSIEKPLLAKELESGKIQPQQLSKEIKESNLSAPTARKENDESLSKERTAADDVAKMEKQSQEQLLEIKTQLESEQGKNLLLLETNNKLNNEIIQLRTEQANKTIELESVKTQSKQLSEEIKASNLRAEAAQKEKVESLSREKLAAAEAAKIEKETQSKELQKIKAQLEYEQKQFAQLYAENILRAAKVEQEKKAAEAEAVANAFIARQQEKISSYKAYLESSSHSWIKWLFLQSPTKKIATLTRLENALNNSLMSSQAKYNGLKGGSYSDVMRDLTSRRNRCLFAPFYAVRQCFGSQTITEGERQFDEIVSLEKKNLLK